MKKVQEFRKSPKMNILSPALKPEEIEHLVTKLATLISMLKSTAKEKTLVSKTVEENREALQMYTSEENGTKFEHSAARMRKNLLESKAALRDCNERLTKVYNLLQDAIASSSGIKYRKEYKEALKLLQDAKQYLRMAVSSSDSRPSNTRTVSSSHENSMLSVVLEKAQEEAVRLEGCIEDDEVLLRLPEEPEKSSGGAAVLEEEIANKIVEPIHIDLPGLLEKECSNKEEEV